MVREIVYLPGAQRFGDGALLAMRIMVGAFLVWGVWDNIVSTERMQEFVDFLTKFGFPMPELMARVSVWIQFFVGLSFITGFLTRWAGILCMINFIVAIAMVDRFGGVRGAFASACLVAIGLYLATYGAGRFSIDTLLLRRGAPSASA
ncbi:MAG: DoxX family protein [Xanthomonadaceae bacterium]|nr:DoxX family protein [Xanthomonadaceae bacterium]